MDFESRKKKKSAKAEEFIKKMKKTQKETKAILRKVLKDEVVCKLEENKASRV